MLKQQRLFLVISLDDLPDCDVDVLVVLACVRLRGLAPAPVEQGAGRRHAGRRWGGLGAADASQRADGQFGLRPRQRSNICCSLSHLASFALHQLVHIFRAQIIDVPVQGLEPSHPSASTRGALQPHAADMLEHGWPVTRQMLSELDGAPLGPAEQSGEPPLGVDQRQVPR